MKKIFEKIKLFLEGLDKLRDQILFTFIKPYWPRKIVPNHLTFVRLIIGISLFILLFYYKNSDHLLIIVLFCVGAVTDLLDGSVARALHEETKLGAVLDSTADRLLLAPIALYFLLSLDHLLLFSLAFLEVINFLISLYAEKKKLFITSNIFGKTKMVVQSITFAIMLILWQKNSSVFFMSVLWISAAFLLLSIIAKIIELNLYHEKRTAHL